jgi:hypothetical protein
MITAERNNKKVTRNVTFFKKVERIDKESEEYQKNQKMSIIIMHLKTLTFQSRFRFQFTKTHNKMNQ